MQKQPDWKKLALRNDKQLLLGITGGVATGKTTVVDMLAELGAAVIDFDILARRVVEPDKPAWKEIVSYFGEQVLQENRELDRKKLSRIVFQDRQKRKKLEGFIHPRTLEEFIKQVADIAQKTPGAIIPVDVPLLIELNWQYLFHKIVVVLVSQEKQIERLIKRDNISPEEARNILSAQLPIDEKAGYADFVIDNGDSLQETKAQVEKLWQELQQLQKKRIKE